MSIRKMSVVAVLAGLSVTGSTWNWGAGPTADSFTLVAAASPVPEPTSLALIGIPTAMALLRRRRRAI